MAPASPTETGLRDDARLGNEAAQLALMSELKATVGDVANQQLETGGEEGLTPATLRRWLVAKKWVTADAVKDLKSHAEWRAAYVPEGAVTEASIAEELAQDKTFLQGCDVDGRPLVVVIVKNHIGQKDNLMCTRFIVYSLDAAVRMGNQNPRWDGKSVGILDLSGMTLKNYDVAALRAVFETLQSHYPERLAKMYLYCAPFIFYGLWRLVSPFVDPVTRSKVQFVFKDKATDAVFAKHFPASVMPPEFGGTAAWVKVEEAAKRMAAAGSTAIPAPAAKHAALVPEVVATSKEDVPASTVDAACVTQEVVA